jgi:hypothetical protein
LLSIDLKIIDNNGVIGEDLNNGDDIDNHHKVKVTSQHSALFRRQRKTDSNLIYLLHCVLRYVGNVQGNNDGKGNLKPSRKS